MPRIRTPPPFLVSVPPAPPLMTPDKMPAVIMVPVLALLLTVTVRAAVPRAMLFVISVSPRAVVDPRTSEVGAKVAPPQVTFPPPKVTTSRAGVPAAKPEAPPVNWTLPAAEPSVRVKVAAGASRTPPLSVRLLVEGMPTPSMARSCPPVTDVTPA